jgi:polyketide synthase 5
MNTESVTPVAVIGMACRLPGGINSSAQLWDALLRGDDLVTEVPSDRWDADEYYDPQPGVPGRSVSKWGAFLDDVSGFDAEFFGLSDPEAAALDPQHRLLLENSWEAMEHAGLTPEQLRDSLTGVFVGLTQSDYQLKTVDSPAMEGPYGFQGNAFSMASGRIAHLLGLRGPALTLDTSGSSGLLAVHLACRSLNDGESDLAFAGGAFVMLEPRKFLAGTAMGDLSPTGRCRAFDIAADGYVYGEGSAVVLLKRLPDALNDGDRILAVVRSTAANHDGGTPDLSTPSLTSRTAVYQAALDIAAVDAHSVGMIETHGTGTPEGDFVEYASLAEVYGVDSPCALASMKTNFGHTQSASGTLGLMKAVLALQHGLIPPNLFFTRLPEALARTDTKLSVPQEITKWPTNGRHPRRAAVSSFGLSGTNAHAILEQAPDSPSTEGRHDSGTEATALLFPLSSTSGRELRRTAGMLADWLQSHDEVALPDLAYTLARRRAHRPVRTAVVADGRADLAAALRTVAGGDFAYRPAIGQDDRGPVWVFSDRGSQWAATGALLLTTEPEFAATVARIEPTIARECGFSVTDAISAAQMITGVDRIQPMLFTVQVALAATLAAYGVHPGAVVGHSLGETAAAVVSKALSLEDGLRVVCSRSQLMSRVSGDGAMASVKLPAKQVLSELTMRREKDVAVAIVAAPQTTVISGAVQKVHELLTAWQQRDVMADDIAGDVAVHSPQVDPILEEFGEALAGLTPKPPEIPFYSATQFDPREEPVCDSRYWVDNLRRTSRFTAAVRAALEDGYQVFAELASEPLLTDALEQTAHSLDLSLAALAGPLEDQQVHGFVADLYSAGAAVDFSALYPRGRLVDAPLPTWTHRRLWLNSEGEVAPASGGSTVSVHPLLGQHVRLHEVPERHVWQAEIGAGTQPWLADHRTGEAAALPVAAYCEMALAAAFAVLGEGAEVRDIRFPRALSLDEQTTVSTSATVTSPRVVDFVVESIDGDQQVCHASAILCAPVDEQPPAKDISSLLAEHPNRKNDAMRSGEGETLLAEIALPRQMRSQQAAYGVHPALLDACFQSVMAHHDAQPPSGPVLALPVGISRVRAYGDLRSARYCYTRVTKADIAGVEANLEVLDEDGTILLAVECLQLGSGESEEERKERVMGERLLTIEWSEDQLPELPLAVGGNWLLITTEAADMMAAELTDGLKTLGARTTTMCWPPHAEVTACAAELGGHLRAGGFDGVVVLAGPRSGHAGGQFTPLGRDYVQNLVLITRALSDIPAGTPHLYVVTRNAQTVVAGDVTNLEHAGLRGLLRAFGTEHPHLRPVQIDVDDATDVAKLASQLLSGSEEDETAWRNNQWYTARLSAAPLRADERRATVADHQRDGMRLQIRTPGDLDSLELVACERISPGQGQIEVAVTASSINFPDVVLAMGRSPAVDGYLPQLGTDFAGVVTAVGPGVVDHRVGDYVGGVANGCWRTFVTCDADLAVPLPDGLSAGQAAAVTTAHATALYGLHYLANVSSGDKVLIHSGTGGVGQAAVAVACAAGAEVFATADSPQHRQMLHDTGAEHVYDSHDVGFAEAIRRDTSGRGVDVVLNSMSGATRRAGIELLAIGGRFVEIGRHDIYDDARLEPASLRRNRSFHGLDLALMSETHPRRLRDVLQTIYRSVAQGELPTPEITPYPIADATSAIRLMSDAQHTGKLVLDIARDGQSNVVLPPAQVQVFRRDGAYIVTNGVNGLGLLLAEKMASAGCGRIVLCAQSRPTPNALQALERVRAMGADVEVEYGEIAEADTARRLVATATATGLPVRGALHLPATTAATRGLDTSDTFDETEWAARVHGAWNVHTATTGQPLDWFCTFTSAAELVGSPGQSAYGAAADSWLNAFCSWRRSQNQPAIAIAWGSWNIGRAASADAAVDPDEGLYALEMLLRYDRGFTGYAPLAGTPWMTSLARRTPFASAFRSREQATARGRNLRAELRNLPPAEWPTKLRRLISEQVSLVLRRTIDPDRPLAEYGVDSLAALELLTRVESETGVRLTPSDIASTSIRDLAVLLCGRLEPVEARTERAST